jgi:ribosomal protein L16 Arg81 hydroxylase
MLDEWLGPLPLESFLRQCFGRRPYAVPSTAAGAERFFTWDTLEQILRQPDTDTLVVAGGKLCQDPAPSSLIELNALMARGIGLVIRRAENQDPALAALAGALTAHIPGQAHVQLFVTPAGTHGFGWHYDDEEVFIVQTAGCKEYFFRDNTIRPEQTRGAPADFTLALKETSPIGTARLIAGDWLYIPSPWWHVARSVEPSLSISIGISPNPDWLRTIDPIKTEPETMPARRVAS